MVSAPLSGCCSRGRGKGHVLDWSYGDVDRIRASREFGQRHRNSNLERDLCRVLENNIPIEGQRPSCLFHLVEALLDAIDIGLFTRVELLQLFLCKCDLVTAQTAHLSGSTWSMSCDPRTRIRNRRV